MPSSQYNFLKKIYQRIPFISSKIGNCKVFKNPLDKFFIFSNKGIVQNRFHKTAEFQDILPRLERKANKWKIAKKKLSLQLFVAIATVCNILILMQEESQVCY